MEPRRQQGEPQIGLSDETRWASDGGASVDARVAEAYASVQGDVVRYLGAVVGRGVAEDVASQVWVEVVAGAGAFELDRPSVDPELGDDVAAAVVRIKRLPAPQAEVVLLRVLGGYSAEEVAELTGRSPGSVRVIQHRALRRLAKELAREAGREGQV